MPLTLRLALVRRLLALAVVVFTLSSTFIEWLRFYEDVRSPFVDVFRLEAEQSVPNWYSSIVLLACGVSLLVIARAKAGLGAPHHRAWLALGCIFVWMSLDEQVGFHELMNGAGPLKNPLYYGWIYPALVIVLLVGLAFLPMLLSLEPRRRRQFIVAGAVYVGSALGMEVPLGLWASGHGENNLGYHVIALIEEAGEICGSSLFLVALLEEIRAIKPQLVVDD